MVNPIIPVVLVFVAYVIFERIRAGAGLVLIFLYHAFLFVTFDSLSSSVVFYLMFMLAVMVIPLMLRSVKQNNEEQTDPKIFGTSSIIKFPLISIALGIGTTLLLKVLSAVDVSTAIFPVASLSILNAGDFTASLLASIGIVEQRAWYILKDVLKLIIPVALIVISVFTPFFTFLKNDFLNRVLSIFVASVVFAIFHIKAFGVQGNIFTNALIIFAILAQVIWLAIEEFTPERNGLIGETGHFFHNASVSLARSLAIAR